MAYLSLLTIEKHIYCITKGAALPPQVQKVPRVQRLKRVMVSPLDTLWREGSKGSKGSEGSKGGGIALREH
jgi:hypothetical protein